MTFLNKLFGSGKNEKPDFSILLNNKKFENFINELEDISIGYSDLNFFKFDNIEKEQIGYSFGENGKSFVGNENGDWKKSWFVIGTDGLDDPIFIDFEKPNFPVFISEHGEGSWEESYIAISLENFTEILKDLKKLSINRENPVDIEKNPIPKDEINAFLNKTYIENKYMDVWYWKLFLENDDE